MGEIEKAKELYQDYLHAKKLAEEVYEIYLKTARQVVEMDKGYITHNIIDPKSGLPVGTIEYRPNNDFITITDDSRFANIVYLKISVLPQIIGIIENFLDKRE